MLATTQALLNGLSTDNFAQRVASLPADSRLAQTIFNELSSSLVRLLSSEGTVNSEGLPAAQNPAQALTAYLTAHAGIRIGAPEKTFREIVLPTCWAMMEGRSVRKQWVSRDIEMGLIDACLDAHANGAGLLSDFSRGALLTQKAVQLRALDRRDEAIALLAEAEPLLAANDGVFAANSVRQLGLCLKDQGRLDEALSAGIRAKTYSDQGALDPKFPLEVGYDPKWQQGPGSRVFLISVLDAKLSAGGLDDRASQELLAHIATIDQEISTLGCEDLFRGLPGFQRFFRQRRGPSPSWETMLHEAETGLALDQKSAFAGPVDFARDCARLALCRLMLGRTDEASESVQAARMHFEKAQTDDSILLALITETEKMLGGSATS